MSSLLDGFLLELRRRGLPISPAERIDAARAASIADIASRAAFRASLRATLAKTREECLLFDDLFDSWFAPPRGRGRRGRGEERDGAGGGAGGRGRSEGTPARNRPEQDPSGTRRTRAGHPEASRRSDAPGTYGPSGRHNQTPKKDKKTPGRLRRVIQSPPRGAESEPPRDAGRERSSRGAPDSRLRRRDLVASFTGEEERRLARAIPALLQEIRLRPGRRFRRGSTGRLWTKRMIRDSLAHGGVPFRLPMKERRPRRPRLVLIVDVSWSVARAAGLFLLLCAGLGERLSRTRVFVFVDRIVEATGPVRAWSAGRRWRPAARAAGIVRAGQAPGRPAPGGGIAPRSGRESFQDLLGGLPELNLQAPSDYGRAFFQARTLLARASGRDTVLVVLGDGRTNRREPLAWAFEEIAARCRRVLWLNPEPRRLWDSEDSVVSTYLPACDVACEVRDLDGLARGVREILRNL